MAPAVEASAREAGLLKAAALKTEHQLADLKRELAAAEADGERLAKQIVKRNQEAARREQDIGRTVNETAIAQRQLASLRASAAGPNKPVAAMEVIQLHADVRALRNSVAGLTRKCEVAAMVAKNKGRNANNAVGTALKREGWVGRTLLLDGLLSTRAMPPAARP
jgi:chromosome segregation ATPase